MSELTRAVGPGPAGRSSPAPPSTLAVRLADQAGMTLVGFLRGPTMNVYAGAGRVA